MKIIYLKDVKFQRTERLSALNTQLYWTHFIFYSSCWHYLCYILSVQYLNQHLSESVTDIDINESMRY